MENSMERPPKKRVNCPATPPLELTKDVKLLCKEDLHTQYPKYHYSQYPKFQSTTYPETGECKEMKWVCTLKYYLFLKRSQCRHLQQHKVWVPHVKQRNSMQKDKYHIFSLICEKIIDLFHRSLQWNRGHGRLERTEERKGRKKLYKRHKTNRRNWSPITQ